MSRIVYNEEWLDDPLQAGRWMARVRAQVLSRRGRQAFVDLEQALMAMPRHRLVLGELADFRGDVCALGSLASYRGMAKVYLQRYGDQFCGWEYDARDLAEWAREKLGIPEEVSWLIQEENDERCEYDTPETRWDKVVRWVRLWVDDPVKAYGRFKAERLP